MFLLSTSDQHVLDTSGANGSHFCPHCLRRVSTARAERERCHEACASGALDVVLLHCPSCGLVLSAEIEPPATWTQASA